jgi:hypothetical protein
MTKEEKFWTRRAHQVCLRHNAAVWLAGWLPIALATTLAAACGILILRRHESSLDIVWQGLAATLALGAAATLWFRWKKFFKTSDGFVRLEAALHLNNRLTAAAAGVGSWPQPLAATGDHWKWRWKPIALQVFGTAALIYLAVRIPLLGQHSAPPKPQTPPTAWTEVETWIDTLKEEDVVQPDSLESLREQLDTLRNQDPESWYDHASLEAGDSLHAETAQAIRDLQQNLQAAADQTSKLLALSDQGISDHDLQAITQALAGALQNMASGRLPLNAELLRKLKGLDPKTLASLSPEKLKELQKQLQQGNGTCQKCLGEGKAGEMMTLQNGLLSSMKGGQGGGGGPAPLTAKPPTDLHSTTTDTVSNDDISHALPGEIVALSAGVHEVNTNPPTPVSGGTITDPGRGGEAVWKDSLTPKERETVSKFFQ